MSLPARYPSEPPSVPVGAEDSRTGFSRYCRCRQPLLPACAALGLAIAGWALWQRLPAARPASGEMLVQVGPNRSPYRVFDLQNASVPRARIAHGGPPVDGIPSLKRPKFVSAAQATFVKPTDRVIGVTIDGQARAYPLNILAWHEAVNDRIDSIPFAVTYCPLCDSAAVFDRRTADGEVEFGISGLLYNSNVLLYDRSQSDEPSLWSQMMAQSVAGPRVKTSINTLPVELTTWRDWMARHPETKVLSTETGYIRDYSRFAYERYFRSTRLAFPVRPLDRRLPAKTPVLGVWSGSVARAYSTTLFEEHSEAVEIDDAAGGKAFTLVWTPEGKSLRVARADDGVQWMYSFWFAWAAFHPETEIYGAEAGHGANLPSVRNQP